MSPEKASSELEVRVIPNASRDQVVGWCDGALKLKTRTPPEAGKANKAICVMLEKYLELPKGSVSVVRGKTSKKKALKIEGLSESELSSRL